MRTYEEADEKAEKLRDSDTEITLGMKSILAIFFGLALICGVFFGFGYSLGRGNVPKSAPSPAIIPEPTAASAPAPATIKTVVEGSPSNPGAYNYVPGPGGPARIPAGAALPAKPAAASAVPPQPVPTIDAAVPTVQTQSVPATVSTTPLKAAPVSYAAQPTAAPPSNISADIMVQIAAVARREDADALVSALRKLGYDASERTQPGDNLLHVQVGPFATRDQAKAMRARLLSDGYNAILK